MRDYCFDDGALQFIEESDRPFLLAQLYGITSDTDLRDGPLSQTSDEPYIRHLHSCDLHGSIFKGLDLSEFCLWQTNMDRTDCRNVNFKGAHAQNASFVGARLAGSSIEKMTTLNECDLRGAIGLTEEQKHICKSKGAFVDD